MQANAHGADFFLSDITLTTASEPRNLGLPIVPRGMQRQHFVQGNWSQPCHAKVSEAPLSSMDIP